MCNVLAAYYVIIVSEVSDVGRTVRFVRRAEALCNSTAFHVNKCKV